jgi:hypothetical protein
MLIDCGLQIMQYQLQGNHDRTPKTRLIVWIPDEEKEQILQAFRRNQ